MKLSECSPLFQSAYDLRDAGAVMHSHAADIVMATLACGAEWQIRGVEMIKGIAGHGYDDTLVVPVIDNTPRECELTASLRAAMAAYPRTYAVMVRRHGIYVWGDTWEQAKRHAECYHYLLGVWLRMHAAGLDPAAPAPKALPADAAEEPARPHVALLDIEGTTTSISFVTEVLFPYARAHLAEFCARAWTHEPWLKLLTACADLYEQDLLVAAGGAEPDDPAWAPPPGGWAEFPAGLSLSAGQVSAAAQDASAQRGAIAAAVCKYLAWMMDCNRKAGPLKAIQGELWQSGYESGELKGHVYADTPAALQAWASRGVTVAIYSSGSRQAQRLLFGYSQQGDLRRHLRAYFDTTSGLKTSSASYTNIADSLGVHQPSDILFATDSLAEAQAAKSAGCQAVLMLRPGNALLPPGHGFRTAEALTELLDAVQPLR